MGRKQWGDENKGFEVEKEPDVIAEFVLSPGRSLYEKKQKEQQEKRLGESAQILDHGFDFT